MTTRRSLFPKTLGDCIEQLTRPALKAQGLAGSRILSDWPSIVGEPMARHAVPEKLSFPPGKKTGGTLTISVENGFATELHYLQPVILERLAGYFGYAAVTRIAISHTWAAAATPPRKRKSAAPLSDCRHLADGVEDAELRAALASLAQALAEPSSS